MVVLAGAGIFTWTGAAISIVAFTDDAVDAFGSLERGGIASGRTAIPGLASKKRAIESHHLLT